jgi:hypothetical protein
MKQFPTYNDLKYSKSSAIFESELIKDLSPQQIQDAENAGDKEKKYQLIRLRNELKRSIHKIQVSK